MDAHVVAYKSKQEELREAEFMTEIIGFSSEISNEQMALRYKTV